MAIVGLSLGMGYYLVAVITTLLILAVLVILNVIEHRFLYAYTTFTIQISVEDRAGVVEDIRKTFNEPGRTLISISVERSLSHKRMKLDIMAKAKGKQALEDLMASIATIPGVRAYKVS